jgi:hypothetical protein
MKNLIWFLSFLIISNFAFCQSEKTLVSNFNIEVGELYLLVDGERKINYWDSDKVKIIFSIETNQSKEVLNVLTNSGRYTLENYDKSGIKVVTMPNIQKEIIIRGSKIVEKFSFEIFLPRHVKMLEMLPL